MKPTEIPREKPRVELKDLPPDNELIAIMEEQREAKDGKTGGLLITFKDRKGNEFTQKYSPMHGESLATAMRELKISDTAELQKTWCKYKMTNFRMGYPRYIPVKKV